MLELVTLDDRLMSLNDYEGCCGDPEPDEACCPPNGSYNRISKSKTNNDTSSNQDSNKPVIVNVYNNNNSSSPVNTGSQDTQYSPVNWHDQSRKEGRHYAPVDYQAPIHYSAPMDYQAPIHYSAPMDYQAPVNWHDQSNNNTTATDSSDRRREYNIQGNPAEDPAVIAQIQQLLQSDPAIIVPEPSDNVVEEDFIIQLNKPVLELQREAQPTRRRPSAFT